MVSAPSPLSTFSSGDGLEVIDLRDNAEFAARRLHLRDVAVQMAAMERLARAFVEKPDTVLQELVNAAVELCGADSAGISLEREQRTDANFYHWVATAGQYSGFLNAGLPRYPSACGTTLQRGGPQLFRVHQAFFDILHVEAPLVTDGLLLPWEAEGTRGTIFVMAHGRVEAFDQDDCRMMQTLANFAATAVRQLRLRDLALDRARATAAAAIANDLAHQINNPLQSLTNLVYLADSDEKTTIPKRVTQSMAVNLDRLTDLVQKLLAIPVNAAREHPPN
jgi:signal transduction histidine kinase